MRLPGGRGPDDEVLLPIIRPYRAACTRSQVVRAPLALLAKLPEVGVGEAVCEREPVSE